MKRFMGIIKVNREWGVIIAKLMRRRKTKNRRLERGRRGKKGKNSRLRDKRLLGGGRLRRRDRGSWMRSTKRKELRKRRKRKN